MCGVACIVLSVAVSAQEPDIERLPTIPLTVPERALPQTTVADDSLELETIYVTARRKTESLEKVPISITVLDGAALGAAGLTLPTDIQERVPGLVVSVPNARLTSYTIRGLGSSSANDGIESSVGLFLDGVYLGRQGLSIFDLVDLDRVEILRGPQGTLFGKNTTAGAINIVTRAPSDEREATLEANLGDFHSYQLRGSVNGALIESADDGGLFGRISGYYTRREGTIENAFGGDDLNERDKFGLRGQVLWRASDELSTRVIAEYGENDEACCAFPLRAPLRPTVAARDAYMEYTRIGTDPYDRRTDSDGLTLSRMRQKALSAEVNWDLAEDHRLVSISAARDWYFLPVNDDGTSLHLASTSTPNEHRQYSQELRLDSSFERADSVVGLYWIRQDFEGHERVVLGDEIGEWVFGGLIRERILTATRSGPEGAALRLLIPPSTLDGTLVSTPYTQISDSVAGFGSVNWKLGERFELTTGLRYTYERKRAEVSRTRSGGNPDASPLALTNSVGALGDLIGVDLDMVTFAGLLDGVAGGEFQRSTRRDEGNYSGQIALSHEVAANGTAYASVARGYKGGGINLGVTGESVKPTFKPEKATAYEVGYKGRFLDQRLSMSVALYHTDVKDYQALTFDDENTLLPNPRQTNLLNVGEVRLRGVELEGNGIAFEHWRLRGGIAYSDAVTTEFPNAPDEVTRGNDKDLSGKTLYNAPRWSGTAGVERGMSWGAREIYGALDWSFRSSYYATVERGAASFIDAYMLTNMRVGLRDEKAAWDVSVWVRNVFDEDYVSTVYPLYGVGDYGAFAGDELTAGLSLRQSFR